MTEGVKEGEYEGGIDVGVIVLTSAEGAVLGVKLGVIVRKSQ